MNLDNIPASSWKIVVESKDETIAELRGQIATLKAAIRKERFFRVWANRSDSVDTVTKIADRQLAKEYPDIDWGGQP